MTSKVEHLMTVVELEALPDDGNVYELIEGEIFESRAPGIPHQLLLKNLIVVIDAFLKEHPVGRLVPGAGLVLSDYDSVIPDILFVTNDRWDKAIANARFVLAPNLVVEILSPGKQNLSRDFIAKRRLYAKYGVEEYWIVDGDDRKVMMFQLRDGKLAEAATLTGNDSLVSQTIPGFTITVGSLFADIP